MQLKICKQLMKKERKKERKIVHCEKKRRNIFLTSERKFIPSLRQVTKENKKQTKVFPFPSTKNELP